MPNIEIKQLSSLAKVFPNQIYGNEIECGEIARGQSFSYQIALRGDSAKLSYKIICDESLKVTVSRVGCVPMTMPTYESCTDEDYLTKTPGPAPDVLFPQEGCEIKTSAEYTALWLEVEPTTNAVSQNYDIVAVFYENGVEIERKAITMRLHGYELPSQDLIFTQWFHADCIADFHGVPVYSEEHWTLIEKYVSVAASHGMNMILTPVLTPPLDTEVGGERTTVQLVKIEKKGKKYTFDFSLLERFIDICLKCGIKYFEINHMFTQWGAKNTPKVVATVDGCEEKIFGWHTDASSKEYTYFLKKLIPAIIEVFDKKSIERSRIYFHVSDEPNDNCIEEYKKAYKVLARLIKGCEQIDAISHFEFYKKKIIKTPVVATNAIEPFLDAKVPNLWCYYCCAQHTAVSNRFMAMPSYRTRIIGVQMYKCSIVGFLHWGFNFYNLQYSKGKINPYEVTDAGGSFPSGDSFSIYPYENYAIPSFRMKIFKNAIDDMRLLTLLEKKIGKESVVALIDRIAGTDVTFKNYPKNEDFFPRLYSEIFKLLNE